MAEIGKYECAWHKWNHVTAKKLSETYDGCNFEGYSLYLSRSFNIKKDIISKEHSLPLSTTKYPTNLLGCIILDTN